MASPTAAHVPAAHAGVRAPASIRNVTLVGHASTGKTTICERLLFASGAIKRMGTVEEGNTVSDWAEAERHHKHSLQSSLMHFDFHGHHINLIDTPGLADYLGHAIAVMPAAETIVLWSTPSAASRAAPAA